MFFNGFYIQSEDEREMCARTVYCTNIDKEVYALLSVPGIDLYVPVINFATASLFSM